MTPIFGRPAVARRMSEFGGNTVRPTSPRVYSLCVRPHVSRKLVSNYRTEISHSPGFRHRFEEAQASVARRAGLGLFAYALRPRRPGRPYLTATQTYKQALVAAHTVASGTGQQSLVRAPSLNKLGSIFEQAVAVSIALSQLRAARPSHTCRVSANADSLIACRWTPDSGSHSYFPVK
jgi:hypothetical protein